MKLAPLRLAAVILGVAALTGCGPGLTVRTAQQPEVAGTTTLTSAADLPALGRMTNDLPYGGTKADAPQMKNDFPYGGEPVEAEPISTWGATAAADDGLGPNPYR